MRQQLVFTAIAFAFVGLVAHRVWYSATSVAVKHEHPPGIHAGALVSLGDDQFHVEAVFTTDGSLNLYTLGNEESRVVEVEARILTAYVTPIGAQESHAIELRAEPQPGDHAGKTSCFSGRLPAALVGRSVQVSVPNLCIGSERFHLAFVRHAADHPEMPAPVASIDERELHLLPGGIYTDRDILANGRAIPSEKFRGFQARHDYEPEPGDQLCPVSRTKANPECSWTVDGKVYTFCCPPCIDEFVRLAKEHPESIQPPNAYVQQ